MTVGASAVLHAVGEDLKPTALDQGFAAFRASVGDEDGHKMDCILALEDEQPEKTGTINETDYP